MTPCTQYAQTQTWSATAIRESSWWRDGVLDPATWEPFADQFAYLSQVHRLTPGQVETLVEQLGPIEFGPGPVSEAMPPKPRRSALGQAPKVVEARRPEHRSTSWPAAPVTQACRR